MNSSAGEKQKLETTIAVAPEHDLVGSSAQIFRRDILLRVWNGAKLVEIDLRRVRMIDSIGIASLIAVYKRLQKAGGTLRLINVSNDIFHLLHVMRLDRHIEVKGS